MGLLIDGQWHDQWYDTDSNDGRFVRSEAQFRNWITADGSRGPTGEGGFTAEPGRYHLYVSLACPWAHRTLIFRKLKNLESMISISVVNPLMLDNGWTFEDGEGVVPDPLHHARYLCQVYTAADPKYSGRVTVPVLWDKRQNRPVNNESAEIIRMLNSAFDEVGAEPGGLFTLAYNRGITFGLLQGANTLMIVVSLLAAGALARAADAARRARRVDRPLDLPAHPLGERRPHPARAERACPTVVRQGR